MTEQGDAITSGVEHGAISSPGSAPAPSIVRVTRTSGDVEWHSYACLTHGLKGAPGATTIIGKKAKGYFFERWLKRQGALAAIRNLAGLPAMVDTSGETATVDFLAKAADKLRDDKGDSGTRIHKAIEKMVLRQPFEVDDDIRTSVEGFRAWANERRPRIVAAEFMVVSERYGYGATGDLLMVVDLREWGLPQEKALVLADAKTGFLADTIALQLAAIRWADHCDIPGPAGDFTIPQATHFAVLSVKPEGTEVVPYDVTDQDFKAFLACRALYEWDRTRSRNVRIGND